MHTFKRLSQVFNSSCELPFDDSSKLIFMSDCHRGDGSWADNFDHNQNLSFVALSYYFNKGFTYVEIGDGDELWENRKFSEIQKMYSNIFELLHNYYVENRLYMIWGNHDIVKKNKKYLEKNLYYFYDEQKEKYEPLFQNIDTYEGLILKNSKMGKEIFIVHGHQADFFNDTLWWLSRFLIRYVWRPLELYFGFKDQTSPAKNYKKKEKVERNIIKWINSNNKMVIAGHTHRPMFPKVGETLYFNTGSNVHPRCITGIEIENSEIMLIKWSIKTKNDGTLCVERDIIAGPQKLNSFFNKS